MSRSEKNANPNASANTKAAAPQPSPSTLAGNAELAGMLALSVRQPFADAIMAGSKTIEYRSRSTSVRGRILIYASLGRYDRDEEAEIAAEYSMGLDAFDALPRGVVIGSVELFDCEPASSGDYAWHLRRPRRLSEPLKPVRQPMPVWFHPFP